MEAVHLYRCPGQYRTNYDITYDIIGVKTEAEKSKASSEGWKDSIKSAAEAVGKKAFYVKKKKPARVLNKFRLGLPVKPHKAPVAPVVELDESFEEKETEVIVTEIKRGLTDSDKEEMKYLFESGNVVMKDSEFAVKYGVARQTVTAFRKSLTKSPGK